jgi:N,N-dimethylformamidase
MKKIVGYSNEISVAPGDAISFMISSEMSKSYTARVVRLIHGDTNPAGPGYREEPVPCEIEGTYPGERQLIHAGSCAIVPAAPILGTLTSFTVQALIWPTLPVGREQVIASLWTHNAGFELFINTRGALSGRIQDGHGVATISSDQALLARHWYLAALSFDAATRTLALIQKPRTTQPMIRDEATVAVRSAVSCSSTQDRVLVFAARAVDPESGRYTLHYNGKIDSPRLYAHALGGAALAALAPAQDITSGEAGLVGAWDFSQDIQGITFADLSGNGLTGRLHQLPTRGMTGYNWRETTRSWQEAPRQYGAIHFHDDDLYDAGWQPSLTWTVPTGQRSGLYALHLATEDDEDYLPFVIRPAATGRRAKTLFLMPTASYMAYGNEHLAVDAALAERAHDMLSVFYPNDVFLMEHREYGGSLYDQHSDGSGICYSSRLRPLLNMRPKYQSWLGGSGSALWQLNADTHLLDWMEAEGIAYDCITDEDLHREGTAALMPYACVVTGTHPEYYSTQMWDALEGYKDRGGNLMALGGNAFHARIAYHRELRGVMEVRRCEVANGWIAAAGEAYHSFTGEYGGLWRRIGRCPQSLAGTGFAGQGFDVSSYYRRRPESYAARAAFIFAGIEEEIIGDFGLIGGGAAGIELDRADQGLGTPQHALILASSEKHTSIYMLSSCEMGINIPGLDATQCPQVHADLVFFETRAGGGVFSTGSIAWAGSLSHNGYQNNIARITGNVLRRFISGAAFPLAVGAP